jgi:hypothetical protein
MNTLPMPQRVTLRRIERRGMTPKEVKMIERFRTLSAQDQVLLLRIIERLSHPLRAEAIAPANNIVKFPLKGRAG